QRGQVQELVDRDVLLDGAQDHPRGADQLVHAEVLEQLLVLRVVDPGDRPRDVEVVLGHLADDEVVFVVARDRRDDVRSVGACLAGPRCAGWAPARARSWPPQPAWELTLEPISSAIWLARSLSFSIRTTSWPESISSFVR